MTFADTPTTWADPEPMSTLHALLFFAGIPLLLVAVISLLVIAPSLIRGPGNRPGQDWEAAPEWFGASEVESGTARRQITARDETRGGESTADKQSGGASVDW